MRRLLLVLCVMGGAMTLGSCGLFNRGGQSDLVDEQANTPPGEEEVVSEADGATDLPPITAQSDGALEGDDVAVNLNSPTIVAPDLIQSTNPNERTIGVERTRLDPFAGLTIPLTPPTPIEPEGETAAAQPANGGSAAGSGPSVQGGSSAPNVPSAAVRQPLGDIELAALPPIPQPTTARAIRVSGVVQVGGLPYAIIQAPNEVERYVRVGERVAGGQVLVKRIDTTSFEPTVILVENGIEVERAVTAAAPPVEAADAATATPVSSSSLPALPSPGI